MTTIVPYVQPPSALFTFNVTLDGQAYIATVFWGMFGRRLYLDLRDTGGVLIFSRPVLGSPLGRSIQAISWFLGVITVTTATPHGFAIAATIDVAISGCLPAQLNGRKRALVTNATQFTFSLAVDPGVISAFGKVDYNIDIAGGYFADSSLVFRPQAMQFEITP